MKENAQDMQKNILESFATFHNPGTGVFMDKMGGAFSIPKREELIPGR